VFINQNDKLFYILSELNTKYKDINEIKEIVIILSKEEDVEQLVEDLESYSNLSVFVKHGDLFDVSTYSKFSLDTCENITILNDQNFEDVFLRDNNSIKILSTIVQKKRYQYVKC
jgi:hypothetical protein